MNSLLERRLNCILETDTTQVADDPYQAATSIATDLEEARRRVTDLERQLMYAIDRLCGGLAVGVRKHQPGLSVGIDKGCCRVGYKSKHMAMRPDLAKKVWTIDSGDPRFIRRFMRIGGPHIGLNQDLEPIAKSIASFFASQYLSLGESITGTGVIVLNGKHVVLSELANHVRRLDKLLVESAYDRYR